jgi:hypothetical protein
VNPAELIFMVILVAILLGVAGYFGWRQLLALRGMTRPDELGSGDRRYLRAQAYRRLLCSFLMVVLAGMLVCWLFFLDGRYRELFPPKESPEAAQVDPVEQEDFRRLFTVYWMVALLVILAMMALAIIDFVAIARYGLSQHRRLQADRRAVLEEHASHRRRDRNGTN